MVQRSYIVISVKAILADVRACWDEVKSRWNWNRVEFKCGEQIQIRWQLGGGSYLSAGDPEFILGWEIVESWRV